MKLEDALRFASEHRDLLPREIAAELLKQGFDAIIIAKILSEGEIGDSFEVSYSLKDAGFSLKDRACALRDVCELNYSEIIELLINDNGGRPDYLDIRLAFNQIGASNNQVYRALLDHGLPRRDVMKVINGNRVTLNLYEDG
ncbi:hypothetical protein J4429_04385 [Candidatus Pacearchaeota archaeon]|nr:hypothetical protein [Candidatus Pacearchaeota archaeon]